MPFGVGQGYGGFIRRGRASGSSSSEYNCVFTDDCLMAAQDTVTNKATANHNVSDGAACTTKRTGSKEKRRGSGLRATRNETIGKGGRGGRGAWRDGERERTRMSDENEEEIVSRCKGP